MEAVQGTAVCLADRGLALAWPAVTNPVSYASLFMLADSTYGDA